jgi:hypothetical protein
LTETFSSCILRADIDGARFYITFVLQPTDSDKFSLTYNYPTINDTNVITTPTFYYNYAPVASNTVT